MFFLTPTDKLQLPIKIVKHLRNDISQQLSDFFNMSFLTGQFPSVLKIVKITPIHKKQSEVYYTNYRPIFPLSNMEEIIENLWTTESLVFWILTSDILSKICFSTKY